MARSERVAHGDMRAVLAAERPEALDSCVTDPPYALTQDTGSAGGFLGLAWDKALPAREDWREVYRVLKPGAYLIAFAGRRTYHRMASVIEDAGFEIVDMWAWFYASGMPHALDVSKAIDKDAGVVRPVVGTANTGCNNTSASLHKAAGGFAAARDKTYDVTGPATEAAKRWEGFATEVKPAHEPLVVAQKPFKGTYAANVLAHGTGALNVNGCRIPYASGEDKAAAAAAAAQRLSHGCPHESFKFTGSGGIQSGYNDPVGSIGPYLASMDAGRWPATVIESDGVLGVNSKYVSLVAWACAQTSGIFACPKPSMSEREAGLREAVVAQLSGGGEDANDPVSARFTSVKRNVHPTCKPVTLFRWLQRLVTPPGGVTLDPYAGSGTAGVAAREEDLGYLLIEREAAYIPIIRARVTNAGRQGRLDFGV